MKEFLSRVRIPGAFWLALIAFVTTWLPQLIPGADWLPLALLVLGALGKAVEVIVAPRITGIKTTGVHYTATVSDTVVRGPASAQPYVSPTIAEPTYAGKVSEFLFG